MVYDTGSSAASLDVDLAPWKLVRGRSEAEGVGPTIEQHAWGKTLHRIEAPARGNPVLGEETFDAPLVSTIVERPDYYRDQLWGQVVIGNTLLLHDIVILDLGAHPAVGLIPSATRARAQADK